VRSAWLGGPGVPVVVGSGWLAAGRALRDASLQAEERIDQARDIQPPVLQVVQASSHRLGEGGVQADIDPIVPMEKFLAEISLVFYGGNGLIMEAIIDALAVQG
jgi:hypothetical protein